MASMSGCQLNFEVPLSILQAVSASQSGHQYEMSGDFHMNDLPPKHLKVLGESKDGIFCFSFKENQSIEGWHSVLNQVWKCQITSIQSVSTSKSVNDELLKPSLGTTSADNMIKKEAGIYFEDDEDDDDLDDNDDVDDGSTGNEAYRKLGMTQSADNDTKKDPVDSIQFPCRFCNQNFKKFTLLIKHMQKKHSATSTEQTKKRTKYVRAKYVRTFSVKNCGHLFEKNLSLCKKLNILPKSSDEKRTGCLLCGKLFAVRGNFARHVTDTHLIPLDRYWQLVSTDDPDQRKTLTDEILLEVSEQKQKAQVQRAGTKPCKCPGCGKLYSTKTNLVSHIKKSCRATSGTDAIKIQELLSQLETISAQNYQPKLIHRSELTIVCPYCSEPRVGRSIFKHLRVTHGSEESITERLAEAQEEYKQKVRRRFLQREKQRQEVTTYSCTFCQCTFKNRTARFHHTKYKCEKNPQRSKCFFCPCGRKFVSQQLRDAHKSTDCCLRHKTYQCDTCGKVYQTRVNLYIHRNTVHEKVVKYVCQICQKGFFNKTDREVHMASHTDARPFQCELCGKNYKTAYDVKRHQRAVHDNKYPYHCDLCGHGVSRKSYLEVHKCGNVRRTQDKANESTQANFPAPVQYQRTENDYTHEEAINPFIPGTVMPYLSL